MTADPILEDESTVGLITRLIAIGRVLRPRLVGPLDPEIVELFAHMDGLDVLMAVHRLDRYGRLSDLVRWLASLDEPGNAERLVVTLGMIAGRARMALDEEIAALDREPEGGNADQR